MRLPAIISRYFDGNPSMTELAKQNDLLTRQVRTLISEIQATDITTNTDSTSNQSYLGTPAKYNTYSKQVQALANLYDNTANWGCMITRNVIDVRVAFAVGEGVKVKKREGFEGSAEAELKWVNEFMRYNNLDEEMPQEYAKEAEIEGKVLWRFLIDPDRKTIRVIHVPWIKYNYSIQAYPNDFYTYTRAVYDGSGDPYVDFDLPAELFVYKRFGGTSSGSTLAGANARGENYSNVNTPPPKTAFVLREIEDLDKAIWDWRKINRIFCAPTPVITAPDKQTAKEINEWVNGSNWRIGKLLVLGGIDVSFDLVGWKGDGYTTLKEETQALAKTISGTTGVPVHFLGYPELLSNRDTADNLLKLIPLSTSKERRTWRGAYEELFQKAMVLSNTVFGTSLNPMAIDADIEEMKTVEQDDATVPQRRNTGPRSDGSEESD